MKKNLKNAIVIGLAGGIFVGTNAVAADWPQWGGNTLGRNMFATGAAGLPDKVEPGDFKQGTEDVDLSTAKNVKWASKLGTQSYGNPTIANGKIFVGTNNDSMRDPKHSGDRSILLCLDEKRSHGSNNGERSLRRQFGGLGILNRLQLQYEWC